MATGPAASAADLPAIIADAIVAGEKRIVIPPGQYRVAPQNREHLRLEGLRDVEIVAEGVELICTETTRAITIVDCQNLTIRGLTIDYDPLPFTQGRIVETAADFSGFTFEIIEGYPTRGITQRGKVAVYKADTGSLRTHTYFGRPVESLGGNRYRVEKPNQLRSDLGELEPRFGDVVIVAARHAPGGSIPHAVYMEDSEGLTFEGVTLYAANMFGFLEVGCNGSVYRRCVIDRRALDDDLKPRGLRRVRSLNADAFHSKSAVVGPHYLECTALYQSDDSFAINGHYHLITEANGSSLRVLGKRDASIDLAVGDPVELVAYTGERVPDAVVTAVEPDGNINQAERDFLQSQRMDARMKNNRGLLNDAYRVTLDRSVDLPIGSVIASMNRIGNGFRIEGCTLGENRSRGILVKSSGVIANNTITGTWGEAIKVAPEWWWLEAGSSTGVRIENNTIRDTRGLPIGVYAKSATGEVSPIGAHRDIVIRGNEITGVPTPAIYITSTQGLSLEGNDIATHPTRRLFPWVANGFGLSKGVGPIHLVNTEE
ncbi:MAG: right-handed parallel beta-helix repeat-containing protein [Planctomycetota bacterium]